MKKILVGLVLLFVVIFILNAGDKGKDKEEAGVKPDTTPNTATSNTATPPKTSWRIVKGTYFMPIDFPSSMLYNEEAKIKQYYDLNRQIGSHVSVLQRWDDNTEVFLYRIWDRSKTEGFKFYLYLDPLTGMTHAKSAPPSSLSGKTFADTELRNAFKQKVLEYAAKKPDVLGIGTEVNLMLFHDNQEEFDNYVSLAKETYDVVKAKYPRQVVTISFSWEIMIIKNQYDILSKFKNSLDLYTFTSYPNIFAANIPSDLKTDFYSKIRTYLPSQKVAISELGWFSAGRSTEEDQAKFIARLPELLKNLKPEYITYFHMFDLSTDITTDPQFNSLGLFHRDGTPKPSWEEMKKI